MKIKVKIIFSLFVLILLIGFAFPAGETTTTKIIDAGVLEDIGNLIGPGLNIADVNASGVELTKEEDENIITFLDEGRLNVKGALFENVEKLSSVKLDNKGEILSANLKASEDTSFTFKGKGTYEIPKGSRLTYEEGRIVIDKEDGNGLFRLKQEIFDEEGNDIGKFLDIKMNGEFVNIEKMDANSVLTGNFEMGDNKIVGIGENKVGRVTLSEKGRISEIWKGTDVTMKNITHSVLGNTLKIYYEENFNSSEHKNENYFNYGNGKIYAGGTGFSTNLGKQNNIFGDMKTTKYVKNVGTKERDFEAILNGGSLEISRDVNNPDVGFNIEHEGDFIIKNGKAVIYSEKGYVIENGKRVLSDENSIFVKADSSKEFSYDLNLNNEYKLEDNIFKDNNGDLLVNVNTPWEDIVVTARNINLKDAGELRLKMIEENKLIYVDEPNFLTWMREENGEALMKEIYDSTETANQNKYGVEVSFLDVYNTMKSERSGNMKEAGVPLFQIFAEEPNRKIDPVDHGLTDPGNIKTLINGGFLPKDFKMTTSEYSDSLKLVEAKDLFTLFSGALTYKKYLFLKDFKELYGDERLTHDEENYWTTYYFNAGDGNGLKALKNRKENYVTVWEGGKPESALSGNPQFNARLRNDFESYLHELGLFNYP